MTLEWTRIFSQLKWLVNKLKTFSVKSNNASSDNITNEISFNEDDDIAPNHNEDKIDDGDTLDLQSEEEDSDALNGDLLSDNLKPQLEDEEEETENISESSDETIIEIEDEIKEKEASISEQEDTDSTNS